MSCNKVVLRLVLDWNKSEGFVMSKLGSELLFVKNQHVLYRQICKIVFAQDLSQNLINQKNTVSQRQSSSINNY